MTTRILIVEDERHIGIGIKYNCEAEGYDTQLVGDGPAALRLLQEDPQGFQLVILDLMLPEMSGYAVLEQIRKLGMRIPVLILSARTLAEDRTRGFDLGADQYMMKPFDLNELISRIRNLLRRGGSEITMSESSAPASDDVYSFNGASINFTRHEVAVRGELKTLTPLEFELLRCFFANEGAVLTRAQLLDNVWGLDATPSTRTVDNFIVRLRRHFEVDPAHPQHFLSVRGVGYRFVKEATNESDEEVCETEST